MGDYKISIKRMTVDGMVDELYTMCEEHKNCASCPLFVMRPTIGLDNKCPPIFERMLDLLSTWYGQEDKTC